MKVKRLIEAAERDRVTGVFGFMGTPTIPPAWWNLSQSDRPYDPKDHEDAKRKMQAAPLFVVTADIEKVVRFASESFVPEPIHKSDPGDHPHGYLWFETPSRWGKSEMVIVGIFWISWTDCITFDFILRDPTGTITMPAVMEWGSDEREALEWSEVKFLQALWRFMQQKITQVVRPHVNEIPEKVLKRYVRDNVDDVLIVILRRKEHRRYESDDDSIAAREWTHRWYVNGHWRNQWYPTLGLHRQRWIEGYVKGPEDKPLVLKERRYVVSR